MHANAGMPLPVSTVKYRVRVMCMLCMTHICSIINAIDPIFLQMALAPSMCSETRRCRNLAGPEETPSVSYWLGPYTTPAHKNPLNPTPGLNTFCNWALSVSQRVRPRSETLSPNPFLGRDCDCNVLNPQSPKPEDPKAQDPNTLTPDCTLIFGSRIPRA